MRSMARAINKMLMIVDGSNLAHRAYNKFEGLKDSQKRPVNLIYGFLRILQSYIVRFRPTYVVVTFDTKESKESNFRKDLLGSYKVHRKDNIRMDYEDFNAQSRVVKRALKYLNIPVIWDSKGLGHESDDYIGWLAKFHRDCKGKVIILSSDKDFCQLIDSDIKVFNPFKNQLVNKANCREIMGYSPAECVDYLCLLGDKSDDIPGYRGIGEVKARKFLDQFGSIQAFLDDPEAEFPGIDRDGLTDLYARNTELIDIDVALAKHPLKRVPIIYHKKDILSIKKLGEVYKKYGFTSFTKPEFITPFKTLKQWKEDLILQAAQG